jgi:hypothetical protein
MNKDLKNQVLDKIHKKEISMYPKTYFIAQVAATVFVSLLVFLLLTFIVSFVFFSIEESGKQFLLGFGIQGIFTFLKLFPWKVIIITILLFILLEWMIHRFKFSYHFPMLRIFIYTILITTFFGIFITFTPIHIILLKKAETNELPIIGGVYDSIHDSQENQGVIRGSIISIKGNTLIVSHNDYDNDRDDGTWNVVLPSGINSSKFYIGEKVYVAGKRIRDTFYAYGIHGFYTN